MRDFEIKNGKTSFVIYTNIIYKFPNLVKK